MHSIHCRHGCCPLHSFRTFQSLYNQPLYWTLRRVSCLFKLASKIVLFRYICSLLSQHLMSSFPSSSNSFFFTSLIFLSFPIISRPLSSQSAPPCYLRCFAGLRRFGVHGLQQRHHGFTGAWLVVS